MAQRIPEQKLLPARGLQRMLESPTTHWSLLGTLTRCQSSGRGCGLKLLANTPEGLIQADTDTLRALHSMTEQSGREAAQTHTYILKVGGQTVGRTVFLQVPCLRTAGPAHHPKGPRLQQQVLQEKRPPAVGPLGEGRGKKPQHPS